MPASHAPNLIVDGGLHGVQVVGLRLREALVAEDAGEESGDGAGNSADRCSDGAAKLHAKLQAGHATAQRSSQRAARFEGGIDSHQAGGRRAGSSHHPRQSAGWAGHAGNAFAPRAVSAWSDVYRLGVATDASCDIAQVAASGRDATTAARAEHATTAESAATTTAARAHAGSALQRIGHNLQLPGCGDKLRA